VRWSWTLERKRRVVAECGAEGASIAGGARRHGLKANQLYAWRRRLDGEGASVRHGTILPVTLAAAKQMEAGPCPAGAAEPGPRSPRRGSLCLSWPQRHPDEDPLARRPWRVALCQAPRTWPVNLAHGNRGRRGHHPGPIKAAWSTAATVAAVIYQSSAQRALRRPGSNHRSAASAIAITMLCPRR
jgi:transposase